MMKTKFTRLTALILAMLMISSGMVFGTGAAEDKGSSILDSSIESVKELLNAISYDVYSERNADVPRATGAPVEVDVLKYDATNTDAKAEKGTWGGESGLLLPSEGTVSWRVNVPKTAKYCIEIEYYPVEGKVAACERIFMVNGKVPFAESRYLSMPKVWISEYTEGDENNRYFRTDIDNNELRPVQVQGPEWRTYEFRDADGFYSQPFEFVLEKGENILSLEAVNEAIAVKSIKLVAPVDYRPYEEVKAEYASKGYTAVSSENVVTIDAEFPTATSSQTIYPLEDRTSAATVPHDASRTILNTIG
ncbi:MAG: hypothetical protein IKL84_04765, partial [Clostridia bacterium]|nr:hypothetical protein [Clostridia bacterium]